MKRVPWSRIVAEGIVIVASILLALAADEWWGDRQEHQYETRLLTRLRSELQADAEQLREKRAGHAATRDAAFELLRMTGPPSSASPAPDSVFDLLWTLSFNWTFDPSGGVVASVLASGDLSSISNEQLRADLAGWPGVVSDLKDQEMVSQQFGHARLNPYLEANTPWRSVMSSQVSDSLAPGPSRHRSDPLAILAATDFEGLLTTRLRIATGLLGKYDSAMTQVSQLLAVLDRELSQGS